MLVVCVWCRERQRDQRKKTEDTVKKAQKFKSGAYERNTKCKRTYDTKCREADKLDEDVAKGAALSPKDFDKLKGKATKARSAAEQADAQYQVCERMAGRGGGGEKIHRSPSFTTCSKPSSSLTRRGCFGSRRWFVSRRRRMAWIWACGAVRSFQV